MKLSRFLPAMLLLSFCGTAMAQNISTIKVEETTRLLKTLSADDMEGRATFSPGIEKAADFIAAEFRRIGLQPLTPAVPGQPETYRQTFNMYRLTPGTPQAQLNNETLAAGNIVFITSHTRLNWTSDTKRQVVHIAQGENFREAFAKANRLPDDVLVLVHPSHAEAFQSVKNYYGKGGPKTAVDTGSSKAIIITDKTDLSSYSLSVTNTVTDAPLFNVAGKIEGKRKEELVVFSGHYDHIGFLKPVEGDSIANGADDDASGTSAVIQLAQFYKKGKKPERTLIFVAFTAEEIGGFGSKYFSEQLNPDQIVAMFNIEMIGKASKFGPNSAYLTGFEKSDLGELLQKRLKGTSYSIHPDPYPEQNLFYRSDNATLARLGVPAHTISSVQIDQDHTYHSVKDEFEQLHMEHMNNMIKAIAVAAKGVVSGKDTPARVDKTQVR